MTLIDLHEIIYQPGDKVIIIDDPEVEDGTKATVKRVGIKSVSGRELIMVRRHDGRGMTDGEDGELYCWVAYKHEIALDPEAEELDEDQ